MSATPTQQVSAAQSISTILVIGAAVAPHAAHLSPWIGGLFGALAALRLAVGSRPGMVPGRLLLLGLTLIGIITATLGSPHPISRDGGVSLLVVMLGLKLVEMRTRRDLIVLALLGYFVVMTQFLYARGMVLALYLALVVWALTALLMASQTAVPSRLGPRLLGRAGLILVQSVPVVAVLFLVFPRLDGPLWSFGSEESAARTGLSDRLEPGSISRLVASGAVALRVDVGGNIPAPGERYFRGPVFWSTNGRIWWAAPGGPTPRPGPGPGPSPAQVIRQIVTMEPSDQRSLLALDTPLTAPPEAVLTADHQILAEEPVRSRLSYEVLSTTGRSGETLDSDRRRLALQVPASLSARVRRLAASWRTGAAAPRTIIRRALEYFRAQPFVYTLSPPRLGDHPTDELLFETRRGFCEHYATSFTLLMRLAGLPARVVTGYQGGEVNPRGGYLILRQSDAHAWSEVWLDGEGWERVDPTAAVAPERVESAIDTEASRATGAVQFALDRLGLLQGLSRQLRWGLDVLEIRWHYWVVGYTRARQEQVLDSLGLGLLRGQGQAAGAVTLAMLAVGVVGLMLRRRPRPPRDPVSEAYVGFCAKLAKAGLVRAPSEGPTDFARRAAAALPELAAEVDAITALYVSLRYGRGETGQARQLTSRVAGLRVIPASGP